jgi:hypothetical protein
MSRKQYKNENEDPLAPMILTAQFLLYVNTILWLGFGVYLFSDMVRAGNSLQVILMISFFLLVNVCAMAFCGFSIGKRDPAAWYFSLFVVVLNAIFTRVGQFQTFNLIAFIVDLIILVVLFSMAGGYLKRS